MADYSPNVVIFKIKFHSNAEITAAFLNIKGHKSINSKRGINNNSNYNSQRLTLLSQSYSIVLQEDNFQVVSHCGVIVDNISNRCDQLDDHLGSVVPRSCLETQTAVSIMQI